MATFERTAKNGCPVLFLRNGSDSTAQACAFDFGRIVFAVGSVSFEGIASATKSRSSGGGGGLLLKEMSKMDTRFFFGGMPVTHQRKLVPLIGPDCFCQRFCFF